MLFKFCRKLSKEIMDQLNYINRTKQFDLLGKTLVFMELALDSLDTTALTKAQLADALFDQLGLNKREAKDFIDAFFEIVSAELAKGESVKISGFGNFEVHTKTARPGRNPQTGEPVVIAARKVVAFRASGSLRQQITKAG